MKTISLALAASALSLSSVALAAAKSPALPAGVASYKGKHALYEECAARVYDEVHAAFRAQFGGSDGLGRLAITEVEGSLDSNVFSTAVLAVTTGVGAASKSTWLVSIEAEDCVVEAVRLVSEERAYSVSKKKAKADSGDDVCKERVEAAVAAEFRGMFRGDDGMGTPRSKEIFEGLSSDEAQIRPYIVITGEGESTTRWLVTTEAEDCVVETVELIAGE